jgi:hypothetical protein
MRLTPYELITLLLGLVMASLAAATFFQAQVTNEQIDPQTIARSHDSEANEQASQYLKKDCLKQ